MPHIDDEVLVPAPLEEVWSRPRPSRYPEWWTGLPVVEPAPDGFTMYPDGWPDYPMPQRLSPRRPTAGSPSRASCPTSSSAGTTADGECTRVEVHVAIPEVEANRLEVQTAAMSSALGRLARLAASTHR